MSLFRLKLLELNDHTQRFFSQDLKKATTGKTCLLVFCSASRLLRYHWEVSLMSASLGSGPQVLYAAYQQDPRLTFITLITAKRNHDAIAFCNGTSLVQSDSHYSENDELECQMCLHYLLVDCFCIWLVSMGMYKHIAAATLMRVSHISRCRLRNKFCQKFASPRIDLSCPEACFHWWPLLFATLWS